jgi:FkbM family methyltransferase
MLRFRSILRLASPPYFFQPLQVLKRLLREYLWRSKREVVVTLPWGLPIKINPHEAIGYDIACHGLYEFGVTETLWRLTEAGDLAIDAGANIGYTASLLSIRAGPRGRVICFEPHPQVFEALRENVEIWRKDHRCGSFVLHQAALGMESGLALLHTNDWFQSNRGTAWISNKSESTPDLRVIEVPMRNLDSVLDERESIGILKMDVQGSEMAVLRGMTRLFERHGVRDIVFEEEKPFPAPTHEYLTSQGYSIFGLQERFAGVRCLPDAQPNFDPAIGPVPNYLATLNPDRAMARLGPAMWRSFGPGRLLANSCLVSPVTKLQQFGDGWVFRKCTTPGQRKRQLALGNHEGST